MDSAKKDLYIFSFVCNASDAKRAVDLLRDFGIMKFIEKDETTIINRSLSNPFLQAGIEIEGICPMEKIKDLIHLLARNNIAGHSPETQIITKPYISKQQTIN